LLTLSNLQLPALELTAPLYWRLSGGRKVI
jgi:hypothetical protein